MLHVLTYNDLQVFLRENQQLSTKNVVWLTSQTNNIYQVLFAASFLNKKLAKKLKEFCSFTDTFSKEFLHSITGYAKTLVDSEPDITRNSLRTYLYLTVEKAIFDENVELLSYLQEMMTFEHSHLRIAYYVNNPDVTKIVRESYNNLYYLYEHKNDNLDI